MANRNTTIQSSGNLHVSNILGITNFILFNTSNPPPYDIKPDKPFIFNGIMMCTCIKGNARFRLNYREMGIEAGQILTVMPGQIIRTEQQSDDFFCEMLFFPLDFIANYPSPSDFDLILLLNEYPCINIPEDIMQSILKLHALIIKHYQKMENELEEEIIKTMLYALLLMVVSVYRANGKVNIRLSRSRQEELTENFFKLLFEYYKQERNVAFYADKLCLTAKYLTTTIRKVTGRYILAWINEIVIIGVKTYLRNTNMTMLQISEEFNFSNPSFFSKYFKQYTGMTPMQYRMNKDCTESASSSI